MKSIVSIKKLTQEILPKVIFQKWQREDVWSIKHRQALIETIVDQHGSISELSYGVPSDGDYRGKLICIDGRQRLTTISMYLNDKFEYDGRTFSGLNKSDRDAFLEYEVAINKTEDVTEEELKEDYFLRQNGLRLSLADKLRAQESAITAIIEKKLLAHPLWKKTKLKNKPGHVIHVLLAGYVRNSIYRRLDSTAKVTNSDSMGNSDLPGLRKLHKDYKKISLNEPWIKEMVCNLDSLAPLAEHDGFNMIQNKLIYESVLLFNEFARKAGYHEPILIKFYQQLMDEFTSRGDEKHRAYRTLCTQGTSSFSLIRKRIEYFKIQFNNFITKQGNGEKKEIVIVK